MKLVHFSDVHGARILGGKFEEFLNEYKPDVVTCGGNFDQVRSIRDWMALRERSAFNTYAVPGNHDHAMLRGDVVGGPYLREQEIERKEEVPFPYDGGFGFFKELTSEVRRDADAMNYLMDLAGFEVELHGEEIGSRVERLVDKNVPGASKEYGQPYQRTFSLRGRADEKAGEGGHRAVGEHKIVLVHGGLEGSVSPETPNHIKALWYRMATSDDVGKNFKEMREVPGMGAGGVGIMLRGHDHEPLLAEEYDVGLDESGKMRKKYLGRLKGRNEAVKRGEKEAEREMVTLMPAPEGFSSAVDDRLKENPGKGTLRVRRVLKPEDGAAIYLDPEARYIVTPGAFREGWFVTIDTEPKPDFLERVGLKKAGEWPVLEYHKPF